MMLAWALITVMLPRVSRASGDVVVLGHSGPNYSVTEGSDAWIRAREEVAKKFYTTHGDNYDFLVVLPTFNAVLGKDADGLHVGVRNQVSGIGQSLFDNGPGFGSLARLKGYIDMRALMQGVPASTEWGAVVLAHEVAHQWSGRVGFKETPSAPRSEALLGRDSAHWSYYLDSEASVLYGSDWETREPGSFESVGRMGRYSALDLYLMGFLNPGEVGPLSLLSPAPEEPSASPADLPPPEGTRISATSRLLGIDDILRAEGPRLPDSGSAQKHFRAAFIVLTPAGQSATTAQLAYAESLRHAFENHFFFLTRGRGIFETDLVEQPPGPVAQNPGVELGLSYLLAQQTLAGDWGSRPESAMRDTQQAVEVLRLFLSSAGVPAALQRADGWLELREPIDVDGLARLSLATQGGNAAALARLRAWLQPSGSVGLSPGYRSTLLDTALLGLALTQPPAAPDSTPAVTRFLLERQNLDGGWPALPGGPSRFEPTALVLEYLARVPRTPAISAAATQAFEFLRDHRQANGLFLEEGSRVASTGWALTSLATWGQLTAEEAFSAKQALLGLQRQDGSWEGSLVDTALALRALRLVLTPNLSLAPTDVQLSATQVTEGETVLATVRVLNTGYAEARNVLVQAFDSLGRPLGTGVQVALIEAGDSAQLLLSLDTLQSGGSSQVFVVADPEGTLDEGKESDNRAAVPLFVSEAPTPPDLIAHAGGVTVTPAAVDRLPAQVVINARVGNLGKTDAPPVEVVARMGTQVLATSQLTLGAQSSQLVSWTVQVASVQASGVITVEVDPAQVVQEPVETNNAGTVKLGLSPGVDLRVTGLTAPATVNQGQDIVFQYALTNGGTTEAQSTGSLEILSGGATVATLPLASQLLAAGGQATGQLLWRANVAGALQAALRVQHPGDLDPSNDTGSTLFEVLPSSLPNLMIVSGSLSITPEPPLETQAATVTVTVRNSGQSEAQGFTVDLYLGAPAEGGTRFHQEQIAALAAGASHSITGTLTLPQDAPERIYVVLDGAQAVSEFDEEDNQSFLVISPVPIADLVVSAADIRPTPAFPREDTSVPVTVSVLNAGGQGAEGVQVELLRVGAGGSEEPIGQATLPAIAPGQRGEALITWNTTGLRGPQRLIAVINRGQTVPEQRADNNRAERQVSVQDAALALSEPYFSPNGDGVRDATEISYRLAAEAPVEAFIEDEQGRRVRVLSAPAASASSLQWDGRSSEGRIVPDGLYRIHVRTLAPATEAMLGTLTAVVDTNRTPLDSSEFSSLEVENLEGTATPMFDSPAAAMPDESGVVFYGQEHGTGQCGLFHQPLGGARARRLTPDDWPCDTYPLLSGPAVSPDARWIAFHGIGICEPSNSTCSTLEILSVADRSILRIAEDDDSQGQLLSTQFPLVFSRDGARVYFVNYELSSSEFTLEEIRVDGTQRRTLARSEHPLIEASLSPGGDRLAVVDQRGALFVIELPQGNRQEFLPPTTITGLWQADSLYVEYRMDLRHGWTASGEALAYSNPGLFGLLPESDGWGPLAPQLSLKDGTTGEVRQLFAGTLQSLDFTEEWAAVAPHPTSGGIAFRHSPLLSTSPQIWTVSAAGAARMLLPYDVRALRWSYGGSFLFGFKDDWASAPLSAITTRDNLFVRLTATRTPGAASMSFQGTVADLNLEEWQLGVRAYGASGPFVAVATSTTPVLNGRLTEWIPPGPGMYEAQLLARDRAGNVRTRTVAFGYSLSPAVANVSRAPEFFSPNGDGVLDTVELRYTITRATIGELQILDASNQVVRQQALPHEVAGDFTLSWDGRDAQGQPVPDGEYTLSLDGTRLSVVVDSTPPLAELSLSEIGDSGLPAPYRLTDLYLKPVAARDSRQDELQLQRIVTAATLWDVQDTNLTEWALEVSSPEAPTVHRPLMTGSTPFVGERAIAIDTLRGSLRLRARDRAGNQTLTPLLQLDDRLFVTLGGLPPMPDFFLGYWPLPGHTMPRIPGAPLEETNGAGTAVFSFPRQALEDGQYAFGLNTSSGSRLVSFSIAYSVGDEWRVDTQNVRVVGENMVIWDARGAGRISELEIRALDENQKLLRAPVILKEAIGPNQPSATRFACVKTRPGEAVVLTAYVGDSNSRIEDFNPAARWSFTAKDSGQVTYFPAVPTLTHKGLYISVRQTISTSALSECEYDVELLDPGLFDRVTRGEVNLCKAQVTLGEDGLSLSESFRQGIDSAEVFVTHLGHDVVVARFGPFEGISPVHPLDWSLFPNRTGHTLRARATLTNGTHFVTEPNLEEDDPMLPDPGCNDEDSLTTPPSTLELSSPLRDADAPLCGIHAPIHTASLIGQGSGRQLQALSVEIVSAQGEVISQPEVSGVVPGATGVNATVRINAQALPEGAHWLRATATWSTGEKTSAKAQPLFIDRTPASTVVTRPAATGRLCPEYRRNSAGVIERYLVVEGSVADRHLESYELLLVTSGGVPQRVFREAFKPSSPSSVQGVLGTIDITHWGDDFELLLSARDVSGSSWCAAPVVVEVATPPSVTALSVSPELFSPNVDGRLDTTTLQLTVDQDVSVTITAEAAGGQVYTIFQGPLLEGNQQVPWDGLAGGTRLADGTYRLRVRATGACGMTGEASTLVRLDTTNPVARIDFPAEGQVLGASFTVTGQATDENLLRYELSLGEGASPGQFSPIASAPTAASGVLGAVSLANLPTGEYTLRLIVEDQAGNSQQTLRRFQNQPGALLQATAVVPTLVSPDGDGVLDTTVLSVTLATPATVSVTLLDGAGQPMRVLVEPTALPADLSQLPLAGAALEGLPDGVYTLRVSADSGSTVEAALASLEIDLSAPHVVLSSPVAGSVYGANLTVEGLIDDTRLESWTLTHVAPGENNAGQVIASGSSAASGVLAVRSGLAEGTHQLVLKAHDRAGHASEQSVSFTVDATPPLVSFLSPTSGAILSGGAGPLAIRGQAEDAHLRSVRLEATTVSGTQTLFTGTSLPPEGLIHSWAVDYEADGPAELHLVAEDAAGNTADSLISLVLDSTPPVAALVEPRGGVHGKELAFRGSATDAHLSTWELELGRGEAGSADGLQRIASSSQPVSSGVLTTLASVGDGAYVSRLRVRDSAGNESVDEAAFTVDSIAPLPAPALSAAVERPNTVALTWEASPSGDVTTYEVFRATASGSAVLIATLGGEARSYLDTGLPDGRFRYFILARDAAGNTSNPSPEAQVEIDATPPIALWLAPAPGERVRGLLELQGTAYSQSDFREYRVSLGAGSSPASFTLLERAPLPVSNGLLGELDVLPLPQGSIQTLRLEAEDLIGNVSEARVTFTVDNLPPEAPVLDSATVSGAKVTLTWQANPEEDVLGFVPFRNGAPLGSPGEASPRDLRPYALPSTSRSYVDMLVPDGSHSYHLVAIDRAGNISVPSNSRQATVETRPPTARLTEPAALERLRHDAWLVAHGEDQDIASIQFEARGVPDGSFATIGAPATQIPFTSRLPLSPFSGRVIELRAIARDSSNKVDPSPASIHVLKEAIPSQPSLTALVDGDQVQFSWTDTNPAGLLAGFELSTAGAPVTQAPERWPGTASATSTLSGSPAAAYDADPYVTGWVPWSPLPQAWTLALAEPVLLRELALHTGAESQLRLEARVAGFWVTLAADAEIKTSLSRTHSLGQALEVDAIRVTFLSVRNGSPSLKDVQLDALPLEHGTSALVSSLPAGRHTYRLRAMGFGGTPSEPSEVSVLIYAPRLEATVASTPESSVTLQGGEVPPSAQVELFNGTGVIATTMADAQGRFEFTAPLVPGANDFQVRATDGAGNRSLPSETVTVMSAPAPSAVLTLALGGVEQSDVSLGLSVEGALEDVAGYVLVREGSEGTLELPPSPAAARSFVDRGVRNGTYTYRAHAFNESGFRGPASNGVTVTVEIAPPAAPVEVAVEPLPSGGALAVSWAPGDARSVAYRVERALGAEGTFEVLAGFERVSTTRIVDLPLSDNTWYRYRILALDDLGNLSSPSLIATGVPVDLTPPAPPRLMRPTVAGRPVTVSSPTVTLSGLTEPGTRVTLLRNGLSHAEAPAGALGVEALPLELGLTPAGSGWPSADGQRVAYVVQDSASGTQALAVESRLGELLGTFNLPSPSLIQEVTFSPDARRVAIQVLSLSTFRPELFIADLDTGEVRRPATTSQGPEVSATWSSDSRELAYQLTRSGVPAAVVVVDLETGSEEWLTGEAGAQLMAPRYSPDGSSLFAISDKGGTRQLVRMDPVSGGSTSLFEAASIEPGYAVSPDSGRIALVANRDGQTDLYTVSVSSGASVRLTHGAEAESMPAFSPDGQRLAFKRGNFLVIHEDGREQRFDGLSSLRLSWSQPGELLASMPRGLARLEWGARFEFTGVRLEPGDTSFSATATDAAQRTSLPAAPIQLTLDSAHLPDLAAEVQLRPEAPRMGHPFDAFVTVRNQGGGAAPATTLSVAVLSPDGQSITPSPISLPALPSGGVTTAVVPLSHPSLQGPQLLEIIVDPEQRVEDPARDNNRVRYPFSLAPDDQPVVAVSVSPQTVNVEGESLATITVANPGGPRTVDVEVQLVTPQGESVFQVGESEHLAPLGAGKSITFTRRVAVGRTLAGPYQVKAVVREGTEVLSEMGAPLTIQADRTTHLRLATSRASYVPGETIALTATVRNDSTNSLLEGASYALTVTGPQSVPVLAATTALPLMAQGASHSAHTELSSLALPPGQYTAQGVISLGSWQLATASAHFSVEGRPLLTGAISVLGQGTPPVVKSGQTLTVDFAAGNQGTSAEPSAALRVAIIDADTEQAVASHALPAQPIEVGGSISGQHDFSTAGLPLKSYAAYLLAERPDGTSQVLASARFRLADGQGPTLLPINFADGMVLSGPEYPKVRVIDAESGVASVFYQVVNNPSEIAMGFTSGTAFDGTWLSPLSLWENPTTLVLTATDHEGNTSQLSVTLFFDSAPPVVTITGVTNGALLKDAAVPVVAVQDDHLASVHISLDGVPFLSGTAVTTDGQHELVVRATDLAGRETVESLQFTVDMTAPWVSIHGVTEGGVFRQDVMPVVTVRDRDLLESSITLDDQPFVPGTVVTAEGAHTLRAWAADRAGNQTERLLTFTVDQTPPAIDVSGVTHETQYPSAVTPIITLQDAHLATSDVRLNGLPFMSGTPVTQDGSYTLTVRAEDLAGWVTEKTLLFSLQAEQVEVAQVAAASFTRVLALVRAGTCTATAAEVQRVQSFLEAELGGPERLLTLMTEEAAFLEALRSGVANVVVIFSLGSTGSECSEAIVPQETDPAGTEAMKIRKAWSRELTEQVFAGHSGLVVIRSRAEEMPLLREALGVDFLGTSPQGQVQLPSSPLAGPAYLSTPAGGVILQAQEPSVRPAAVYSENSGKLAGALYTPGQGRSVTFGVDLTNALPAAHAALALRQSVAHVMPAAPQPAPLGVAGVELRLTSRARDARLRVVETLPSAVAALWASSEGGIAPGGRGVIWEPSMEQGSTRELRMLVRLPEGAGSHAVSAAVTSLRGTAPLGLGPRSLELAQPLPTSELLTRVRAALEPLQAHDPNTVSEIEARLERVEARRIEQRGDIEATFEDLFVAIESTRHMGGDSTQVRKALGDLLRYWEARWYLL
ncbi:MAG: PD40 domain-containing protein [Myxococcaceae bacterium]|nr:PD40 domain-containing protein [Myxococcaceae bacterium]